MDRLNEHPAMRIAVVIPVLSEHAALERLLGDLGAQSRVPDEVIIVAGARDEQVAAVARQAGHRLIEAPTGRGVQLDAGAQATNAEVLWFVHADARLPRQAGAAIADAVQAGAAGGCLRLKFQESRTLTARTIERLVRLRIACHGMAYGDQALFCTRAAYVRSGGFLHVPLFEEVQLVRHLQHERRFVALPTPVYVSTRRWERDGWLQRSAHNRWLALRHALGATPETLARSYESRTRIAASRGGQGDATETNG